MGYQRNEYDCCVMNKIIENKQCTVLWHVDDLKKSHVNPAVVFRFLDAEYGKIAKMSITWGKVYKYLGVTIEPSLIGKVILLMVE